MGSRGSSTGALLAGPPSVLVNPLGSISGSGLALAGTLQHPPRTVPSGVVPCCAETIVIPNSDTEPDRHRTMSVLAPTRPTQPELEADPYFTEGLTEEHQWRGSEDSYVYTDHLAESMADDNWYK